MNTEHAATADDSKERSAYHEAAHAVIAATWGVLPDALRIKRDRWAGRWDPWGGDTDFPRMPLGAVRCHVAIAGFLAEAKWEATTGCPCAVLAEFRTMSAFLEQVRNWERCTILVNVPVITTGEEVNLTVAMFDGDLSMLKRHDESLITSALVHVRRQLNDTAHWYAVDSLARSLLDAESQRTTTGEAIEIGQHDVASATRYLPAAPSVCGEETRE